MGINSREAIVDNDLRALKLPNFWVASTSTFPTLGTANATLTLMLLTLRLGDHLSRYLWCCTQAGLTRELLNGDATKKFPSTT